MASFARTWNLITHDWLFVYIYQDINRVCFSTYYPILYPTFCSHLQLLHGRRLVATISVVLISAIIHEYVIWASLKTFYPIITGWFFGFGSAYIFFYFSSINKIFFQYYCVLFFLMHKDQNGILSNWHFFQCTSQVYLACTRWHCLHNIHLMFNE